MISKQKGTYDLYGEEARKVLALRNIFENKYIILYKNEKNNRQKNK